MSASRASPGAFGLRIPALAPRCSLALWTLSGYRREGGYLPPFQCVPAHSPGGAEVLEAPKKNLWSKRGTAPCTASAHGCGGGGAARLYVACRSPFNNSAPLRRPGGGGGGTHPLLKDWAKFSFLPSANQKSSLAPTAPIRCHKKKRNTEFGGRPPSAVGRPPAAGPGSPAEAGDAHGPRALPAVGRGRPRPAGSSTAVKGRPKADRGSGLKGKRQRRREGQGRVWTRWQLHDGPGPRDGNGGGGSPKAVPDAKRTHKKTPWGS